MRALLIIAALSIVTCCQSSGQREIVRNERYNYQINVPTGWTVDNREVYIDIFSPKDSPGTKSKAIVSISTDETEGKSIDECFDFYLGQKYREEFDGFVKVREGSSTVNGHAAKWIEHECLRGGVQQRYLVYLIFTKDRFFVVTAIAAKQDYQNYLNDFKGIINSFSVPG